MLQGAVSRARENTRAQFALAGLTHAECIIFPSSLKIRLHRRTRLGRLGFPVDDIRESTGLCAKPAGGAAVCSRREAAMCRAWAERAHAPHALAVPTLNQPPVRGRARSGASEVAPAPARNPGGCSFRHIPARSRSGIVAETSGRAHGAAGRRATSNPRGQCCQTQHHSGGCATGPPRPGGLSDQAQRSHTEAGSARVVSRPGRGFSGRSCRAATS